MIETEAGLDAFRLGCLDAGVSAFIHDHLHDTLDHSSTTQISSTIIRDFDGDKDH